MSKTCQPYKGHCMYISIATISPIDAKTKPKSTSVINGVFFDCTWCQGRRVSGKNNSKKVFWEFDSIIMQNVS